MKLLAVTLGRLGSRFLQTPATPPIQWQAPDRTRQRQEREEHQVLEQLAIETDRPGATPWTAVQKLFGGRR